MEVHREDTEMGPTYKTLFLGAVFVLGNAFGWWITNFISTDDTWRRDTTTHVNDHEARLFKLEERDKYRDAKLDDHEERIRRFERK